MVLLTQKVLRNIVLRRTKKGRAADLALPPRMVKFPYSKFKITTKLVSGFLISVPASLLLQVMLRRDTLDVKEEDYYQSLYNESQAQFNT